MCENRFKTLTPCPCESACLELYDVWRRNSQRGKRTSLPTSTAPQGHLTAHLRGRGRRRDSVRAARVRRPGEGGRGRERAAEAAPENRVLHAARADQGARALVGPKGPHSGCH
eukprot:UN4180